MKKILTICALAMVFCGCRAHINHGGRGERVQPAHRVYLPPFTNATDDDHAGRALTELTASALYERDIPVVQTEPALTRARAENAAGADGLFLETARALNATHLLIGTVHEYRYKTDLDGDPAVGITLRLVDATSGETLWQGTSSKVTAFFASVTGAAQSAARDLVAKIPLHETK